MIAYSGKIKIAITPHKEKRRRNCKNFVKSVPREMPNNYDFLAILSLITRVRKGCL